MTNWNICEEYWPGPHSTDSEFTTNYFAHGPTKPPKVGELFFNSHGQCLGLVVDIDSFSGTLTLKVQGSFS